MHSMETGEELDSNMGKVNVTTDNEGALLVEGEMILDKTMREGECGKTKWGNWCWFPKRYTSSTTSTSTAGRHGDDMGDDETSYMQTQLGGLHPLVQTRESTLLTWEGEHSNESFNCCRSRL